MLLELPMEYTRTLPGYGWRSPGTDYIKINTDGSVSPTENRSGAGGVARTSSDFIAAWSKPHENITDPLIAEALALRDGVIFGKLRGFSRVIFEADCLELVQLWNSRQFSCSLIAPILLEIGGLASSFVYFDILHVMRQSNTSAHLCAKHASTLGVSDCWMNSPPGFLALELLVNE